MDEGGSLSDQLREAGRRIVLHPGYQEHLALEVLERSLGNVFVRNRDELMRLLESASTHERVAFELIQNVREPLVRERFYSELTQRLHNYLASSASLVDHVRRLMRKRAGPIADEFECRKAEVLKNPEVPFIDDLRDYTLHRTLPFFAHSLSVANVNTPEQTMESEVELNTAELLSWRKWSSASRSYLEGLDEVVTLRPVVRRHAELVVELNVWLLNELKRENEPALGEVNALVVARNAVLTGGDLAAAERISRWED